MNGSQLWTILGRHGARLYAGAPAFVGWSSERAFANLTGEPYLDLNIACLHGQATADDAGALLEVVDAAAAPAVIPVSPTVDPGVAGRLAAAGFVALPTEATMWRPPGPIEPRPGTFDVRRVDDESDRAAAGRVIAEAHGVAFDVIDRVIDVDAWHAGVVGCWIAWDGDEPTAAVWLTTGDRTVGVWEVMTSPRHRRRGAARAVLTTALDAFSSSAPDGAALWATPMGRPLYATLGFEVVEEVTPWVRGGTAEELAMIGATLPS